MIPRLWLGSLVTLSMAGLAVAYDQTTPTGAPAELARQEAVGVMRRVNTAQSRIRGKESGPYGTLMQVLAQDPTLQSQVSATDDHSGTAPGYKLTLVLTEDRRRYLVSLLPAETCGLALFSNEGGFIYRGSVLDCPAQ